MTIAPHKQHGCSSASILLLNFTAKTTKKLKQRELHESY